MRVLLICLLFSIAGVANANSVLTQMECMPTTDMVKVLELTNEIPNSFGQASDKSQVVIYRKKDRTTWTLVKHYENSISCVIAVGTNWQFINPYNFTIIPQPEGTDL